MPWPIRLGPEPTISTLGRSRCGRTSDSAAGSARRPNSGMGWRRELGGARVHRLEHGADAKAVAQGADAALAAGLRPQLGDLPVRQTRVLGLAQ